MALSPSRGNGELHPIHISNSHHRPRCPHTSRKLRKKPLPWVRLAIQGALSKRFRPNQISHQSVHLLNAWCTSKPSCCCSRRHQWWPELMWAAYQNPTGSMTEMLVSVKKCADLLRFCIQKVANAKTTLGIGPLPLELEWQLHSHSWALRQCQLHTSYLPQVGASLYSKNLYKAQSLGHVLLSDPQSQLVGPHQQHGLPEAGWDPFAHLEGWGHVNPVSNVRANVMQRLEMLKNSSPESKAFLFAKVSHNLVTRLFRSWLPKTQHESVNVICYTVCNTKEFCISRRSPIWKQAESKQRNIYIHHYTFTYKIYMYTLACMYMI